MRLPGGDQAVAEPWRMACAWLAAATGAEVPAIPAALGEIDPKRWEAIAELVRSGVSAPLTSSVGRLFDAVAALCGVRGAVNYEGQAAAELEAAASGVEPAAYPMPLVEAALPAAPATTVLDARETVRAVVGDLEAGVDVATIAARFHNGLAAATAQAIIVLAEARGTRTAVLSGGVFQNRLLLERTATELTAAGMRLLLPERLPPNDGGIAYGQAAVAAARTS